MRHTAAVTFLIAAGVAQAHPGHVVGSFWHLFTEPDHLAMLVLPWVMAAAVVCGWKKLAVRRERKQDEE